MGELEVVRSRKLSAAAAEGTATGGEPSELAHCSRTPRGLALVEERTCWLNATVRLLQLNQPDSGNPWVALVVWSA